MAGMSRREVRSWEEEPLVREWQRIAGRTGTARAGFRARIKRRLHHRERQAGKREARDSE